MCSEDALGRGGLLNRCQEELNIERCEEEVGKRRHTSREEVLYSGEKILHSGENNDITQRRKHITAAKTYYCGENILQRRKWQRRTIIRMEIGRFSKKSSIFLTKKICENCPFPRERVCGVHHGVWHPEQGTIKAWLAIAGSWLRGY
jgi:hypothetical protein